MNSVPLLAWPSAFSLNGQWLTPPVTWPHSGSTNNNQADSAPVYLYVRGRSAHPPRALSFNLRDPRVSTKLHSPTLTARNAFQAPTLVPCSQAAASRLSMTTFMFHESGKRPPFDSIQLRQCVFLDMCIINMDNDFRIKIPNGDMIEKSMSFPPFLFLRSSTTVYHPVFAFPLALLSK